MFKKRGLDRKLKESGRKLWKRRNKWGFVNARNQSVWNSIVIALPDQSSVVRNASVKTA